MAAAAAGANGTIDELEEEYIRFATAGLSDAELLEGMNTGAINGTAIPFAPLMVDILREANDALLPNVSLSEGLEVQAKVLFLDKITDASLLDELCSSDVAILSVLIDVMGWAAPSVEDAQKNAWALSSFGGNKAGWTQGAPCDHFVYLAGCGLGPDGGDIYEAYSWYGALLAPASSSTRLAGDSRTRTRTRARQGRTAVLEARPDDRRGRRPHLLRRRHERHESVRGSLGQLAMTRARPSASGATDAPPSSRDDGVVVCVLTHKHAPGVPVPLSHAWSTGWIHRGRIVICPRSTRTSRRARDLISRGRCRGADEGLAVPAGPAPQRSRRRSTAHGSTLGAGEADRR